VLGVLTLAAHSALAQPQLKARLGPGPVYLGSWPASPGDDARDVKVVGQRAYVALGFGGVAFLDVADPTNCFALDRYESGEWVWSVAVAGNYAYVTDGNAGLQVIDVSNPTNCVRVGGYDVSVDDVGVAGNYAYVTDGNAGLQVIDVSNPTNCVLVGGCNNGPNGWARRVAVVGNYAYVADDLAGLQVIDVSDPTNCVQVGDVPMPPAELRITLRWLAIMPMWRIIGPACR
jgi:hypothetical protein